MKKVCVILSGCGVFDGAEIHESVLTLLALDQAGAKVTCAAPDIDQYHVIDHQLGQLAEGETRSVRAESARIARGPVEDLAKLSAEDFDVVILPGGFGAAKNLCTFALDGGGAPPRSDLISESGPSPADTASADQGGEGLGGLGGLGGFTVNPVVEAFLKQAQKAGKPLGLMCIAPVIAAKLFGDRGVKYTIGSDEATVQALAGTGAEHVTAKVDEIVVDEALRIVTTPAYMLAQSISEAEAGISKLVKRVLSF